MASIDVRLQRADGEWIATVLEGLPGGGPPIVVRAATPPAALRALADEWEAVRRDALPFVWRAPHGSRPRGS